MPPLAETGLINCPKVLLLKECRLDQRESKTGRSQGNNSNSVILSHGCLCTSGSSLSAGHFLLTRGDNEQCGPGWAGPYQGNLVLLPSLGLLDLLNFLQDPPFLLGYENSEGWL